MGEVIADVVYPAEGQRLGQITEGFSIHGQHTIDEMCGDEAEVYAAWVYLGDEIVWHYEDRVVAAYDGLEDFTAYAFRRFARRLAYLLEAG